MRTPRHVDGLSDRVRVRTSGLDPRVVQLSLADQAIVPDRGEVSDWVEAASTIGRGATVETIRTGALFPDAARIFADAGFHVIDTLALLDIDLEITGLPHRRAPRPHSRPLRPRHHGDAANVDRAAFADPLGNDRIDLAEIRRATPAQHARARFAGPAGQRVLVGFAITGAARRHGYLQRLAVDPAHQCHGHGKALVVDSLRWMDRRRLTDGVVNTGVGNTAALALYAGLGFRPRPEQLRVMQLDLATA